MLRAKCRVLRTFVGLWGDAVGNIQIIFWEVGEAGLGTSDSGTLRSYSVWRNRTNHKMDVSTRQLHL
jgi:hypothetical protein